MIVDDGIDPSAKPVHILWACVFMKVCASEPVNCTLAAGANNGKPVCEETFRKWSWHFVEKISDLYCGVIMWDNGCINDVGEACLVTVDGTDFRIYEPTPFWGMWKSHKFNGPALRCEVAICIQTGSVVWIDGPFPAGKHDDLTIFQSCLKGMLDDDELVEADGPAHKFKEHCCLTIVNQLNSRIRNVHLRIWFACALRTLGGKRGLLICCCNGSTLQSSLPTNGMAHLPFGSLSVAFSCLLNS